MRTVLIANRGEIACRIIKTCRMEGYKSVAIFSEADRTARHVKLADDAIEIGPSPVKESYLNIQAILNAAKQTNSDLVHPGYGLLAENALFATAVTDAGLIWIGSSPANIRAMADKDIARRIAVDLRIPILPGSTRLNVEDRLSINKFAQEIGFPILIKATGGGGGIGMRLVNSQQNLLETAKSISSLASRIFSDSGFFLERHIKSARHIEIQIFGLGDGRVFHLFERDCSIQRRFQKIIEEAPAPHLDPTTLSDMTSAACRLAASQNYSGAGTVEFLLDNENGKFFFLEMNTRIQVEHPVTEMVTGQDIVALQLAQAVGESLDSFLNFKPPTTKHAIECRLYAENPERNFLPSPGVLEKFSIPNETCSLRIDTGYEMGDSITPFYDPMIAKIIASGKTRPDAINEMIRALEELEIQGISTNLKFLKKILRHQDFLSGKFDTKFVDNTKNSLTST